MGVISSRSGPSFGSFILRRRNLGFHPLFKVFVKLRVVFQKGHGGGSHGHEDLAEAHGQVGLSDRAFDVMRNHGGIDIGGNVDVAPSKEPHENHPIGKPISLASKGSPKTKHCKTCIKVKYFMVLLITYYFCG